VPRPLALFEWEGLAVLALEIVQPRGFAARSFGEKEAGVLEELSGMGKALEHTLGVAPGLNPMHGDFAPWNTSSTSRNYVVWDWEDARLGLPLEDYFHWHVQLLLLFGIGSVHALVKRAVAPDRTLVGLCQRFTLDDRVPEQSLRAYLERRLRETAPESPIGRTLRTALDLLVGGEGR
jgi:hypothetical protein